MNNKSEYIYKLAEVLFCGQLICIMRHESRDELQLTSDLNTHESIVCPYADDTVVYFAEPDTRLEQGADYISAACAHAT